MTRRLDQLREAKRLKDFMAAPIIPAKTDCTSRSTADPGYTSTEEANSEASPGTRAPAPAAEPGHTNTQARTAAAELGDTNTEAPAAAAEPEHTNTAAPTAAAEPEHTNTAAPTAAAEPEHTNTAAPTPAAEPEHTNTAAEPKSPTTAFFEESYTQPDEDPYMQCMHFEKLIADPVGRPIATPVRSSFELRVSQDAQVLRSPTPTEPEPQDLDFNQLDDRCDDLASRHQLQLGSLLSETNPRP